MSVLIILQTAVVDIPHSEFGQEPFAIVEDYKEGMDKARVEQIIIDKFGREYALGGVCTLHELGLSTWPMNATGKVVKTELKEAVLRLLESSTNG